MKVRELQGAPLDYWVARADESWKWAHNLFPTMTLDPTFARVELYTYDNGGQECLLIPRNPMRQDTQVFAPSTEWEHGGPLLHNYRIGFGLYAVEGREYFAVIGTNDAIGSAEGPTHLTAACRAIVASKFGEEVPDEVTT
jgi:hypothetical protein